VPSEDTDCLIVGAGPAGLSAALRLCRLGVSCLVLEGGDQLGDELRRINLPIRDFLGCSAENGRALLATIEAAKAEGRLPVRLSCCVEALSLEDKRLVTSSGSLQARAMILAMGLRRRVLELPGEAECRKRGVSLSGTTDLPAIGSGPVAVVGGGDGALENALILAEQCSRVHLVHRGSSLRAQPHLVERVAGHERIQLWLDSQVLQLHGADGQLTSLDLGTPSGRQSLVVPWLVVKIGFEPNTQILRSGPIELDGAGYVVVDRNLHTSVPGVFAAGDLSNPRSPSIAAAVGDGAVAAKEAARYLWARPCPTCPTR